VSIESNDTPNAELPQDTAAPESHVEMDWDNPPIEREANERFLAEARRQGRGYRLVVEGYHQDGIGTLFVAPNDQAAMWDAHITAYFWSRRADGHPENDTDYPTHPYKLYHRDSGRLVKDYTPPTPEEVTTGKVELWYRR